MKSVDEIRNQIIVLAENAYAGRGSNIRNSLEQAQAALQLAREISDTELIAKCLNHLSLFYMITGENDLSISTANEAIKLFSLVNDEIGIADAKYNIGSVYHKTDNYHLGLTNLVDALSTFKKYEDYAKQSRTHKSIGAIYECFGDEKNALQSYHHAVKAAQKVNNLDLETNAYNPLSGIYLNQQDIDKAIEYIENSIRIKTKTGDIRGKAFALYGRAKIYTYLKRYDEAQRDFKKAEKLHVQFGEKSGLAMVYYKMGVLFLAMENPQDALSMLHKGRQFCIQHNITQFKYKCDFQLYLAYKQIGDVTNSLLYLEEYLSVKEAVINIETQKIIQNYELVTQQKLLENSELIKANDMLVCIIHEKELLIKEIHHRVKNNLQLISSILFFQIQKTNHETTKKPLEDIRQKIRSISLVHEQLLQTGNVNDVNIANYLSQLLKALKSSGMNPDKNIKIFYQVPSIIMNIDQVISCGLILNELFTNAIKYAFDNRHEGKIEISLAAEGSKFIYIISDDGLGLPEDVKVGSGGFGMQVLDVFLKQLGAKVEINRSNGTEFRIEF